MINNSTKQYDGYLLLFSYIERVTGTHLSPAEKQLILPCLQYRVLARRQYLLQEGEICDCYYFVVKGALRMFSDNSGHEFILDFAVEYDWLTDQESLNQKTPSDYNIETLEPSLVLILPATFLKTLSHTVPAIREFILVLGRLHLALNQKRLLSALAMSAAERYKDMLRNKPEFARRFTQHHISAYLGVKPETLSRVLKQRT